MPRRRKRRRRYYVFTADLHPDAASLARVRRRNPDRITGKPCVYIGYCTNGLRQRFADGDFSSSGSPMLRGHATELRADPRITGHSQKQGALSRQDRLIRELREQGWTVANAPPPENYSVYVIELRPAVAELSTVQRLNPHRDPRKKCVYVGQTSKTSEERFQEHLNGIRASRYVRDHGVRLLPRCYEKRNPMTELESLRTERNLAGKLRREGYTVLGGH